MLSQSKWAAPSRFLFSCPSEQLRPRSNGTFMQSHEDLTCFQSRFYMDNTLF